MTAQTKHYLIVGGALLAAVVLGIVVYKRYQAGASTSQAASDQSNQDALAFLEANAQNSPYGSGALTGTSVSLPAPQQSQSLADEIASIEKLFGFASSAPAAASSSPSPAPSPSPSPAPGISPGNGLPVAPRRNGPVLSDEPGILKMEHEEFVS